MRNNEDTCGARTNKEKVELLRMRQGYPLKLKIALTERRIREWYEAHDGLVYVAFSGGKDSSVLLNLVWSLYPDVPAVFSDTGNELQSIREHVESYGDKVIWVKPKVTFWEVVDKYGWPIISKKTSDYINRCRRTKNPDVIKRHKYGLKKDGSPSPKSKIPNKWWKFVDGDIDVTNKCCGALKNNPTSEYRKKTGRTAFVGTMADESDARENSYINHGGCNAFNQKDPCSRAIMFWTEQDVLQYHVEKELSLAGAYGDIVNVGGKYKTTDCSRTGCKFCMFGVHLENGENRIQYLSRVEPDSYDEFVNRGGDKVMDAIGVDWKPYNFETQTDLFDPSYEIDAKELVKEK